MSKTLTGLFASVLMLTFANSAQAGNVEIYLVDMLDNIQNGYCLDIARAQGDLANPDDGLQGHTCYSPSGTLGVDQTFDDEMLANGTLYMPEFDVCAEVPSVGAGSSIDLAACDGSAKQSFEFLGEGTIVPASATEMCLTLAEDTRTGRSDTNQIKVLSLEGCADKMAGFQTWAVRSLAD